MEDPDDNARREKLLVQYQRIKKDPFCRKKDELDEIIKKFIDSELDEIRIAARQEYHHNTLTWRFYVNGAHHRLLDVLDLQIITSGKEFEAYSKDIEGVDYLKKHCICKTSTSPHHIIVLYCTRCNVLRLKADVLSDKLRPCTNPLCHYIINGLGLMVSACEVPRDPSYIEHWLLSINIIISWKDWIPNRQAIPW